MQRLGLIIQIVCVALWFVFAYLAIVWHPALFFVGFLPYIIVYNVIFRGFVAAKNSDSD